MVDALTSEYDLNANPILPVYDYEAPVVTHTETGIVRISSAHTHTHTTMQSMAIFVAEQRSLHCCRSETEQDVNIWDEPPDSPSNIVVEPTADKKAFTVRYGTFNKLIEFLTSDTPKGRWSTEQARVQCYLAQY
jgi:hypothetical protein